MSLNETLKTLSDPTRREILNLLKKGSLSAGDIAAHFGLTGATISHHLAQLKKAELISERKEKNFIFYSLNATVLEEVLLWMEGLKGESK